MVGALRAHVGVAAVQEEGCWAAFNMSFTAEGKAALRSAGVGQAVRDAARDHPDTQVPVQRLLERFSGNFDITLNANAPFDANFDITL
eukprot:SAG25_NODE_3544_length_1046_cov_0.729673_1_plen_88_part_10